jgi:hypothetical protein
MKTGTVLDMDMASLSRSAGDALRWWLDELAAMVPARWQRRGKAMAGIVVELTTDGSLIGPDGTEISDNGRTRAATILLPPGQVLIREAQLPALRQSDLQRLVALDLDRLMPFPAGSAYGDVAAPDSSAGVDGKILARIAALPKEQVSESYARAVDHGLSPRAIGLRDQNGRMLAFDFLPALIADGGAPARRGPARWWVLVAVLFLANVGVMLWQDMQSVARLQALVDAQTPLVNASRKLTQRLANEDKTRSALMQARRQDNALAALALVSRAMPRGAWVQRYSWNGETLRLSGYQQEKVDVLGALRKTGAFASVRAATSDVAAEAASGQPFDISAEWATP